MPVLDHFGMIAPLYDRVLPLRHADHLIEVLGLPVEGLLLDAGGGTGRVAHALRREAAEVIVADVSMKMLRQAQDKGDLETVNTASEALPFADGTFERVLMVDALHHVVSQVQTAAELWRVLKPGGRIVIEEPDVRKLIVKLVALAEKAALMRSHFLSPPRIASLFPYPGASTHIRLESYNAWIIVEKLITD